MTALSFSQLYPLILPYAKRVDQPGMNQCIVDAARDFCMHSKLRRVSVTLEVNPLFQYYDMVGQPMLDAGATSDEEALYVQAAAFVDSYGRSHPLTPVQPEQVTQFCASNSGQWPCGFWLVPVSQISLWPVPQQSGVLMVRAVLQPTTSATTLDSTLIQMADRTIAYGALERLLNRNDEPYSNPRQADKYGTKYVAGRNKAGVDADLSYQPFNQTTAMHRF